jgi:uncharacterized damage-inducible protein DinB
MTQPANSPPPISEPWLRGTLTEVPAVARAVIHALQLAQEDLQKCCADLRDAELNARPSGLPPIAFHLRHIARSIDRLLSYAEGRELAAPQLAALKAELDPGAPRDELFAELTSAIEQATTRIKSLATQDLATPRTVGKKQLPTTLAGLLVHAADHTQRHVGQAVTTAKIVLAARNTTKT